MSAPSDSSATARAASSAATDADASGASYSSASTVGSRAAPGVGESSESRSLQRAVYVSKIAPDQAHNPTVLSDILRVSRLKNRAAGITGMLVYFEGRFLQYLEGPGLAVYGTLSLIRGDTRHVDMEILLDEQTDRRLFRTWDMGSLEVGSEAWLRLVQASWPTMRPLSKNSPSGLDVLQELAQHPEEDSEHPRVIGGRPEARGLGLPVEPELAPNLEPIPDVAPERFMARLQIAGLALFAVFMLLLIFHFIG